MSKLLENIDYYWDNNLIVFTEYYHRKRGYCCGSGCRNCPYLPRALKGGNILKNPDFDRDFEVQSAAVTGSEK